SLDDQTLFGQPTLSGGFLYVPTDRELRRIDARKGTAVDAAPWDVRVGPMANFVIMPNTLIGVADGTIAALGPPSGKQVALPLYEATDLEARGKLEEAAEKYNALLSSKDSGEVLQALIARTRILQRLNKRDEALAALDKIEHEDSEQLTSFNGLWQVKKDV